MGRLLGWTIMLGAIGMLLLGTRAHGTPLDGVVPPVERPGPPFLSLPPEPPFEVPVVPVPGPPFVAPPFSTLPPQPPFELPVDVPVGPVLRPFDPPGPFDLPLEVPVGPLLRPFDPPGPFDPPVPIAVGVAAPEPGAGLLLLVALGGIAALRRR